MYLHPSVGADDGDGLILCERHTHKVMTALILVSIFAGIDGTVTSPSFS